jgi:prepilin-type N-terminal cleavage/methylation domain-containing protein
LHYRRKNIFPLSANQGFTLIEILISITILSFLMIGVYQIIDNSTISKETVTSEDRALLQLERALSRFNLDFSLIHSPRYFISLPPKSEKQPLEDTKIRYFPSDQFPTQADNGMPIPKVDTPEKSTLIFMTAANRRKRADTKESTYAWVKYSLQSGKDSSKGQELVRTFTPKDPYAPEIEWEGIKSHLLLTGVKSLEFLFWSSKKEKFVDRPKDLAPDELIKLIKVKLIWIDNREIEHNISRTFRTLWPYFNPMADQLQIQQSSTTLLKGQP